MSRILCFLTSSTSNRYVTKAGERRNHLHSSAQEEEDGIEAVLLEDSENVCDFTSMHFFCRNKRSSHQEGFQGLGDVSNHPLLQQKKKKNKEVYNTTPIYTAPPLKPGPSRPIYIRPLPAHPPRSSYSPSKDVALAWLQMGSQRRGRVGPQPTSRSHSSKSRLGTRQTRFEEATHRTVGLPVHTARYTTLSPRRNRRLSQSHQPRRQERILPPAPLYSPSDRYKARHRCRYCIMGEWKSAVDPKSGRTYYYNVKTRETQWRKPMELASDAERNEMEAKERKQKEFFAMMEKNILASMASGEVALKSPRPGKVLNKAKSSKDRPDLVRTISTMEDTVLKDLVKRTPSHRGSMDGRLNASLSQLGRGYAQRNVLEKITENSKELDKSSMLDFEESSANLGLTMEESLALEELAEISEEMTKVSDDGGFDGNLSSMGESLDLSSSDWDASAVLSVKREDFIQPTVSEDALASAKPALMKRNTCGTIYVSSTMSAPDKDATIKCVCAVYRAHILASDNEEKETGVEYDYTTDKFRKFNDREKERKSTRPINEEDEEVTLDELKLDDRETDVPRLEDVTDFYRDVFRRAQMESDCIIMSLIYVERLIKTTGGKLRPRKSNWRSLLFSSMILSSKVWDDLSMWNADFSQTCPAGVQFSLQRINELELCVLNALKFVVKVPASEYAKYYFLLRSMLIKSGLGGGHIQTPLDVDGAKKLEQVSSGFQSMVATKRRMAKENALRSKSMGEADKLKLLQGAQKHAQGHASLEHLVKM